MVVQGSLFDVGAAVAAEASARMVVMTSRFNGKCKRCGKPIAAGSLVDWVKGQGATHATEADCAVAPAERVLRGPQPEDPEERMMAAEYLLGARWKSATSDKFKKLPHQYSLRKWWSDEEAYEWCIEYIRRVGYEKFFIGRLWVYYDIGEHQYWDCGGPVSACGLINRAVRR